MSIKNHRFVGLPGEGCGYVRGTDENGHEAGTLCAQNENAPVHNMVGEHLVKAFERVHEAFGVRPGQVIPSEEEDQHWPGSAGAVWQSHTEHVAELLRQKQAYGDAWKRQGYMGNLARVLSKSDRLRNLMWADMSPENEGYLDLTDRQEAETVIDTLMDLSALCSLMIYNIQEGNRWGQ